MEESGRVPEHPVLAGIAKQLDKYGWAAWLSDSQWRLVWVSSEFVKLFPLQKIEQFYGRHMAEFVLQEEGVAMYSTQRSTMRAGLDMIPALIQGTPGGRDAVRKVLEPIIGIEAAAIVEQLPATTDPVWTMAVKLLPADGMSPVSISALGVRICDEKNEYVGNAMMWVGAVPFRLAAILARGDVETLERSASLTKPGRRQAAVLFADLQSSSLLSRTLPSATFFKVVQTLITAIDRAAVGRKGVVGRHAGDGLSAFFLVEHLGSPSAACRAAVEAAQEITSRVSEIAAQLEIEMPGVISASDCKVNVGVHWGGALYMGQLLTEGRLEVTALGDAVNECARMQESARDGQVLVSKGLIENLAPVDATALALNPDSLVYRTISEIPSATEKAKRDAGAIPVVALHFS
jgi:class 3 adenylate cyclase